jgi:hypothetical protein
VEDGAVMSELHDTLRKVRALIAQADHPNTGPAEADVFRAKAEALMFKYRIDEAMLTAEERADMGISVRWLDMDVCDGRSEFRQSYYEIIRHLINHLDVRADFIRTVGRKTGDILATGEEYRGPDQYVATVKIVGFESDLVFIESMYAAARLAFSSKLEPRYDATLSDEENCYNMRQAGMEGVRIAKAVFGDGKKSNCVKARKLAQKWAAKIGDDGKAFAGHGMKLYRDSYAQGFVKEYAYRLYNMRMSRGAVDTGLVLANRKEQIDEAFYTRFPDRRPKPVEAIGEANVKACEKCAKAKSGYCSDHRWMKPSTARSRVRYANDAAWQRGASAARTVDLGITGREVT